jgi:hypothetical protein
MGNIYLLFSGGEISGMLLLKKEGDLAKETEKHSVQKQKREVQV